MEEERELSIWFFVGAIVFLYGIIIFMASLGDAGIASALHEVSRKAGLAWGVFMTAFGALFLFVFRRPETTQNARQELGGTNDHRAETNRS